MYFRTNYPRAYRKYDKKVNGLHVNPKFAFIRLHANPKSSCFLRLYANSISPTGIPILQ